MQQLNFQKYYEQLSLYSSNQISMKKLLENLKKENLAQFDECLLQLLSEKSIIENVLKNIKEMRYDELFVLADSIESAKVLKKFVENETFAAEMLRKFSRYEEYLTEQKLTSIIKKDDWCIKKRILDFFMLVRYLHNDNEEILSFVDYAKSQYRQKELKYSADLFEIFGLLKKGYIFEFCFEIFKKFVKGSSSMLWFLLGLFLGFWIAAEVIETSKVASEAVEMVCPGGDCEAFYKR